GFFGDDVEVRASPRPPRCFGRRRPFVSDVLPHGNEAGTGSLQHGRTERLPDREGLGIGRDYGIGFLRCGGCGIGFLRLGGWARGWPLKFLTSTDDAPVLRSIQRLKDCERVAKRLS